MFHVVQVEPKAELSAENSGFEDVGALHIYRVLTPKGDIDRLRLLFPRD